MYNAAVNLKASVPQRSMVLAVGLAALLLPQLAPAAEVEDNTRKPRISVLDFDAKAARVTGLNSMAAAYFNDMLVKLNRFDLVEREAMKSLLQEQKLAASGIVDASTAAEMGKILGLDYIIMGQVTSGYVTKREGMSKATEKKPSVPIWEIWGTAGIAYRFIDVQTGTVKTTGRKSKNSRKQIEPREIKKVEDNSGDSDAVKIVSLFTKSNKKEEAPKVEDINMAYRNHVEVCLAAAIEGVKSDIYNAFPLTAYVLEVLNPKKRVALIDIGSRMGVKKGDKFSLIRQHPSRIHPVTKKPIPGKKEVLGDVKVSSVSEDSAEVKFGKKEIPHMEPGSLLEARPRKQGFFSKLGL